ncbi:hypothetical protein LWI29_000591 [Acer saccharum]|uniref:Profilin n=1 Tax=Acer saccharum TaxID=4024 RepID=A0AA39SCK6_ACESA|nr:hypothetical protein LWI29_000591 [Acer saccharum]
MDWSFVHKAWEKWASLSVGSSGEPLKAALLINYDPTGPSRLLSTIAEQGGLKADPIEMTRFVDFIQQNKLETGSFITGSNECCITISSLPSSSTQTQKHPHQTTTKSIPKTTTKSTPKPFQSTRTSEERKREIKGVAARGGHGEKEKRVHRGGGGDDTRRWVEL